MLFLFFSQRVLISDTVSYKSFFQTKNIDNKVFIKKMIVYYSMDLTRIKLIEDEVD